MDPFPRPGQPHRLTDYLRPAEVLARALPSNDGFPNNPRLPLLVYRTAFDLPDTGEAAAIIEQIFAANHWGHGWRNGVYRTDHYHSTAHEVLGCYDGRARIRFGGRNGEVITARRGDVLILPAGTAHKNLGASQEFAVVGCYPDGQDYDMNFGRPDERPRAEKNIASVALPAADPVYGSDGPLMTYWS